MIVDDRSKRRDVTVADDRVLSGALTVHTMLLVKQASVRAQNRWIHDAELGKNITPALGGRCSRKKKNIGSTVLSLMTETTNESPAILSSTPTGAFILMALIDDDGIRAPLLQLSLLRSL